MQIVDNQNRKRLEEGRNYGMGFAFLKQVAINTYETVQPISQCKDYLNDVVYSEATGKRCEAYGLSYEKQGIFEGSHGYICFSILDYHSGDRYQHKQSEIENVTKNFKNIEGLLNYYEDEVFGLDSFTEIEQVDTNMWFAKIPVFWCSATFLISLWSLLVRASIWYDGKKSPEEYLKGIQGPDAYNIPTALTKLPKINSETKQDMSQYQGNTDVHNCGIIGYNQL